MQGYSYNTHSYMEQAREEGFHTKEKRSPIEGGGGTTSSLQVSEMFVWGGAEKQVKTNLASHKLN